MHIIGWLLGLGEVKSISEIDISLGAAWASGNAFWIFLLIVLLGAASIAFYGWWQDRGPMRVRILLGVLRAALLALLLVTLCDPILQVTDTVTRQPQLFLVFDGSDSMSIDDVWTDEQKRRLDQSAGVDDGDAAAPRSRIDYLRAMLSREDQNLLARLQEEKQYRLEAFIFDGNTTSSLRKLERNESGEETLDPGHIAEQLTTSGQVTALGAVLGDVGQQFGTGNLAGVVLFSDFAHNSGSAPLGTRGLDESSPASRLGVPVYAVGLGATENIDLAVDLQTDPKMKKAERTTVLVKLRQMGLDKATAQVKLHAQSVGGAAPRRIEIGERTVTLAGSLETVEFPFTPQESGPFEFVAEVTPIGGEVVEENNVAVREVNIIDNYLRLMYVASEPTWEWRFVKEVFHRDRLVGMDGFRTYLASSDARVRESNVLFMPILTPPRSQFFANDVIFLGDMPGGDLNDRFCTMLKEYVGKFGGGLVVIAGPRFGPQELAQTPLADMLPVVIDPRARMYGERPEEREFKLQRTAQASRYPFMQLGADDVENAKAWDNLDDIPWFQPVAQVHQQAVVLAEHPTRTCADGKTKQPLIAIRQYGAGEVVYLGFNEMWRLRRLYGERYYRAFWSQLIYRLGMSHALGQEKRFVVRTDRQDYRAEETVTLTVEAYDENFDPLTAEKLAGGQLSATILVPGDDGSPVERPLAVPPLREGVFEARIPVYAGGAYGIRVTDPVTGEVKETRFDVAEVSAERRSGVRNERLQDDLALETQGRSYDLTNVSNLLDDLSAEARDETLRRTQPLWATPLWFLLIVPLMLLEWFVRKLVHLT
ncbi:MAG: hypothetical protein RIC55_30425 [Pirellulaceae bacterium]